MNNAIPTVIPVPSWGQAPAGIQSIIIQLKKRRSFSLQADGESMLPLLHPKDLVNYHKISFSQIKINDLVLVFKNNLAFTHRVIYKIRKYLITKGDNNLESDSRVSPKQVVGKVISVKRKNKIIDPEMLYLIQSSLYFKEIVKIVSAFEQEKINHVFLKGLPVHLHYEKTHPQRIYQDADVLIDKVHYKKVTAILIKFGYKSVDSSLSTTQKRIKDKIVEMSFYKLVNDFPVVFDIHLEPAFMMNQIGSLEALYPQKLINQLTEELLNNKQPITISDQQFFILDTKYLILYLALHFFHHNFTGPFRLDLLNKIIRKKQLKINDWQSILQIINHYQLANFVSPVFYLLKKYYQTPLPNFMYGSVVTDPYNNLNIFNDESRLKAGINRFKNLFFLSPRPLVIRLLVLFNFQIIYLVFFTLNVKFKNLLKNNFKVFKLNQ